MSDFFSFIGAADAYIDLLTDTGVRTGLELQGNCKEFIPKPDSERKESTANGRSNWGQVLDSVTLPKPMTVAIKFNQLSRSLFAAAFFGTDSDFTQSSGSTLSAPDDVTVIHDKWVEIGKLMISNQVVQDPTETDTYVLGTDYEINTRLGMIKALSTGDIEDGEVVKFGCDYAAIAGSQMAAMTKSNVRIRVKLDGQNFSDGRNFIADAYQIRLNPTSNFSFISDDFVEAEFEGVLETPSGYSEPMKYIWLS